jgi:16S rRNA processing protein RimM
MGARRILLGVIGRPHGVRGLVHVTSHTDDPAALAGYGPLTDERDRRWTLQWRGEGIAELCDEAGRPVADRNEAEALLNLGLYADRDRLPPTGENEFYLADLVGLSAVDGAGAALGRVERVHDYGAGASLEIAREGASLLVPFTRSVVPEVDLAAGFVTVFPPKAVLHKAVLHKAGE